MRTAIGWILAFSLLTLFAGSASAAWSPRFRVDTLHMTVGESATVEVRAIWHGLTDYGEAIHWTFGSSAPTVAEVSGLVDDKRSHDVDITALEPGTASVCLGNSKSCYVDIFVSCGEEDPVLAGAPAVSASLNEPVTLSAVSNIASRTRFFWYRGRIGDRSQPIDAAQSAEISYAPAEYGVQYVWVSAVTACSMSEAGFRIDVPRPRQRAVRR